MRSMSASDIRSPICWICCSTIHSGDIGPMKTYIATAIETAIRTKAAQPHQRRSGRARNREAGATNRSSRPAARLGLGRDMAGSPCGEAGSIAARVAAVLSEVTGGRAAWGAVAASELQVQRRAQVVHEGSGCLEVAGQ